MNILRNRRKTLFFFLFLRVSISFYFFFFGGVGPDWASLFSSYVMGRLHLELVFGQPIPDAGDVNLELTLAPPMVDDQPAPPGVGGQQAPVVADIFFPERGGTRKHYRATVDSPSGRGIFRGAAGCIKRSRPRSPCPQKVNHQYHGVPQWENSRSIRERIFVLKGDDEIYLEILRHILSQLKKRRRDFYWAQELKRRKRD